MYGILQSTNRLVLAALVVRSLGGVFSCGQAPLKSGDSDLVANQRHEEVVSAAGLEGGSLTNLALVSDAACDLFGGALTPSPDAVYSLNGPNAWLWLGPGLSGTAWAGLRPADLGLAGSTVFTARCAGGKLLVGTDKGLEWISLSDRSTGIFTRPVVGIRRHGDPARRLRPRPRGPRGSSGQRGLQQNSLVRRRGELLHSERDGNPRRDA